MLTIPFFLLLTLGFSAGDPGHAEATEPGVAERVRGIVAGVSEATAHFVEDHHVRDRASSVAGAASDAAGVAFNGARRHIRDQAIIAHVGAQTTPEARQARDAETACCFAGNFLLRDNEEWVGKNDIFTLELIFFKLLIKNSKKKRM